MSSVFELPDELGLPVAAPAPPAAPARPHLRAVPDVAPLDFDEVVRNLTPRLQRYATRRLGDRHEAEELVQEALLRAYDHRAELLTEDDVAAWSTCVTGRLVIDRLRVRGRSTSVAEVPEGSRTARDTADVVVARDEARTALDALDAMPPRQAAVLWAREVEGLAYDEIGTRFGMTEPAVRSVLSRARKALRKEYATRGGTLPAAGLVALAPWIDGLTWADRLRRVATRTVAPAALSLGALGLVTGALVTPWSAPAEAAPTQAYAVSAQSARPATPAVAAPAAAPVRAGAPAPASPAVPEPVAAARSTPRTVVEGTGLNTTCVGEAGTVGAGGEGCAPEVQYVLEVDAVLPDNPTGVRVLSVENSERDCQELDALPLLTCTTTGGQR